MCVCVSVCVCIACKHTVNQITSKSLTPSHTHSLTYSLTHSHTHTLTHSHTHTLTHSHTHTQTHTLSHSLTHSHTHSLSHTHTHSLSHTHTNTHTLSLTHTLTHSLTLCSVLTCTPITFSISLMSACDGPMCRLAKDSSGGKMSLSLSWLITGVKDSVRWRTHRAAKDPPRAPRRCVSCRKAIAGSALYW